MYQKFLPAISLGLSAIVLYAATQSTSLEKRAVDFKRLSKNMEDDFLFNKLNNEIKDNKRPVFGKTDADYIACYSLKDGRYTIRVHPDQTRVGKTILMTDKFKENKKSGTFYGKQFIEVLNLFYSHDVGEDINYGLGTKKKAKVVFNKKNNVNTNVCVLVEDSSEKIKNYGKNDKLMD